MDALLTVAGFLAGDQAYRTLANLNQCSKLVSAETLTILYEKVVWEDDTAHWIVDKGRVPDAWSYTRFLQVNEASYDKMKAYQRYIMQENPTVVIPEDEAINLLFPNLELVVVVHEPKDLPKIGRYSSCTATLLKPMRFAEFLQVVVCGFDRRSTGIRDVYLHKQTSLRRGHHYQIEKLVFAGQGSLLNSPHAARLHWRARVSQWEYCDLIGDEVKTWSTKGYLRISNFLATGLQDLQVMVLSTSITSKLQPLSIFDHLTLQPANLPGKPNVRSASIVLPETGSFDGIILAQLTLLDPFRFRDLDISWQGIHNEGVFRQRINSIFETTFDTYLRKDNPAKVSKSALLPAGETVLITFTANLQEKAVDSARQPGKTSGTPVVWLVATITVIRAAYNAPKSLLRLTIDRRSDAEMARLQGDTVQVVTRQHHIHTRG